MIEITTGAQDSQLTSLLCENIMDIDAGIFLDWVRDNFSPDDIFDESQLESWARDNNFERPE